ncbi:Fungal Zn2-Cys6 binuclear cluster domain-containing protein [Cladophialophora immunda]|nr:Fungal Zn2-Cys6 binuclear cluster domain-containing protein [Cladophialophora immunda]
MESRGLPDRNGSQRRPAISRRSCDQCRARKIGCDRAVPCSHCISVRTECTHSATRSTPLASKQRVLISTEYERKIDDLAKNVDEIRRLLTDTAASTPNADQRGNAGSWFSSCNRAAKEVPKMLQSVPATAGSSAQWEHSAHLIDFVKDIVEDRRKTVPGDSATMASLRCFVRTAEAQKIFQTQVISEFTGAKQEEDLTLPPVEAATAVIRWARDHAQIATMRWVSRILPLEKFAKICQKLYFPTGDHDQVDLVVGNGYLSYMFSEHANLSGLQEHKDYGYCCRINLRNALLRLPLLLKPCMETIAALTIGAASAIESSQAAMAWSFISAASSLCITLRYHCGPASDDPHDVPQADRERLFWTVYAIDKALSLRLRRLSNIRDSEVTLSIDQCDIREAKLGRIQGQIYEQLHSPKTPNNATNDKQRSSAVEVLAEATRDLIRQTNAEISDASRQLSAVDEENIRLVYLKAELVCQSSVLTSILHAAPGQRDAAHSGSDECVAAARSVFQFHAEFLKMARFLKNDPFLIQRYMNWALLNIPFVPFNILLTRTLQQVDDVDLARMEGFTNSLQLETDIGEGITHPHSLYKLLCRAAQCYIAERTQSRTYDPTLTESYVAEFSEFEFRNIGGDGHTTPGWFDWYNTDQWMN